jgi:hypothetical protein
MGVEKDQVLRGLHWKLSMVGKKFNFHSEPCLQEEVRGRGQVEWEPEDILYLWARYSLIGSIENGQDQPRLCLGKTNSPYTDSHGTSPHTVCLKNVSRSFGFTLAGLKNHSSLDIK